MDETQILDSVAAVYGISLDDLLGYRKFVRIAEARKMAYYLLRELTDLSTTEIGRICGGRDHSTVIFGSQAVERRMEASEPFAAMVDRMRKGLWDERGALA